MKRPLIIVLLSSLTLCATTSHAINNLRGMIDNPQVEAGVATTLRITWTGSITPMAEFRPVLTSAEGQLTTPDGTVVATLGDSLSQPFIPPLPGQGSGPLNGDNDFTLRESLNLSAADTIRLAEINSQLMYRRQFSDGINTAVAEVTILFNRTASSGLTLTRSELRFDDRTQVRALPSQNKLGAYARLQFAGAGLIDALWEIADPTSTGGEPVYYTLANTRQYVSLGGQLTLLSPPLPSHRGGWHSVRLRVQTTSAELLLPPINYYVIEASNQIAQLPVASIRAQPLPPRQPLDSLRFRWDPVAAASAYKLEIFGRQAPAAASGPWITEQVINTLAATDTLITALYTQGDNTQAVLTEAMRQKLRPAQRYQWRITAFDALGQVIALSPLHPAQFAPGARESTLE